MPWNIHYLGLNILKYDKSVKHKAWGHADWIWMRNVQDYYCGNSRLNFARLVLQLRNKTRQLNQQVNLEYNLNWAMCVKSIDTTKLFFLQII